METSYHIQTNVHSDRSPRAEDKVAQTQWAEAKHILFAYQHKGLQEKRKKNFGIFSSSTTYSSSWLLQKMYARTYRKSECIFLSLRKRRLASEKLSVHLPGILWHVWEWNWRSVLSDGATMPPSTVETVLHNCNTRPATLSCLPRSKQMTISWCISWIFLHQSNKISNTIDLFDSATHDCWRFLEQMIKIWGLLTLSLFQRACQWWCPW